MRALTASSFLERPQGSEPKKQTLHYARFPAKPMTLSNMACSVSSPQRNHVRWQKQLGALLYKQQGKCRYCELHISLNNKSLSILNSPRGLPNYVKDGTA